MFWFSYTMLHGQLVIMDVSEDHVRGLRWYTASYSLDPRVCCTDLSPEVALARLTAHLETLLAPSRLRVSFMPTPMALPV